jgi:hypothetical protein
MPIVSAESGRVASSCECASDALALTLPLTSMLTLMLALYEPVTATDVPPDPYAASPSPRFKELDPDDLA